MNGIPFKRELTERTQLELLLGISVRRVFCTLASEEEERPFEKPPHRVLTLARGIACGVENTVLPLSCRPNLLAGLEYWHLETLFDA